MRYKAWMSTLTTPIEQSTRSPYQYNKARRKCIHIGKEKVTLSLSYNHEFVYEKSQGIYKKSN